MTGFECIGQAIELFEDSLHRRAQGGQPPIRSVLEWARRTGYSVHHFTRLFSAVTGTAPKEYLSGRILTEAALEVVDTRGSLAQVALRLGYPDYETFSRAFKRHFSLSPGEIRGLHHVPGNLVARLVPQKKAQCLFLESPEPTQVERDQFTLAGLPFFIGPQTTSYHAQWAAFLKVEGRIARTQPPTFYQFSSWIETDAVQGMSVLCGLETDPETAQEPFFTLRRVPAARYLRFVHVGEITSIGRTYEYIYADWLAHHEIRPACGWEFQRYPDGSPTEIWIPLAQ